MPSTKDRPNSLGCLERPTRSWKSCQVVTGTASELFSLAAWAWSSTVGSALSDISPSSTQVTAGQVIRKWYPRKCIVVCLQCTHVSKYMCCECKIQLLESACPFVRPLVTKKPRIIDTCIRVKDHGYAYLHHTHIKDICIWVSFPRTGKMSV